MDTKVHDSAHSKRCGKAVGTVPVKIFTQELLRKLHPAKQPDALAVAKISGLAPVALGKSPTLILEEVHDSFNLGTILRCAEAFGIKHVLCVIQNAAARLFSPRTLRSSMGAIFRLKLSMMENASAVILHCRRHGVHIVATPPHCDELVAWSNLR